MFGARSWGRRTEAGSPLDSSYSFAYGAVLQTISLIMTLSSSKGVAPCWTGVGAHHQIAVLAAVLTSPDCCSQMNRESSRSHLIISIVIESTNLQTQNVTKGKLSFVDLAGSERCACALRPE